MNQAPAFMASAASKLGIDAETVTRHYVNISSKVKEVGTQVKEVGSRSVQFTPPSEATPLRAEASLKENVTALPNYVQVQSARIHQMSKEGPLSFRVFAFLGGLIMVITSVMDFVISIFERNGGGMVIAFYTCFFGFIISLSEGKRFACPMQWESGLRKYFSLINFSWGKGVLCFFAGSLQLTSVQTLFSVISGAFMMGVGFLGMMASQGASTNLSQLKKAFPTEASLQEKFEEYDAAGDGYLGMEDFKNLCAGEGVVFKHQQLVAAFGVIDQDDDDKISMEDLRTWWGKWNNVDTNFSLERGNLEVLV